MIREDILRESWHRVPDYNRANEVQCSYWNVAHWYDLYDLSAWVHTWHDVLMCLALRAAEECTRVEDIEAGRRWLDRADAHRRRSVPIESA